MLTPLTGLISIIVFFIFMLTCVALGQYIAKRHPITSGLSVTEGAVFTLMGLLVAFTFANASQRYDLRRAMITEEANAINTAYLRLDMLKSNERLILKQDFIAYINSRIATYQAIPNFDAVAIQLNKSKEIQAKLWQDAINACKNSTIPIAPMLILPAINTMFDIANTRTSYTYFHPHYLIFVLLLFVALLSAFLTGYGMTRKGAWNAIHVIAFVLIITITIYIIIDLEYPRLGIITENKFDMQLMGVQKEISK